MVTRSPFAQDIGELADLVMQLAIGDVLGLGWIIALPDDRGLLGTLGKMPIDAVVGGVEDAVLEPFDRDVAGAEGAVLDLGRRLVPVQALGLLGPEAIRVLERARVHLLVLVGVDIGAFLPLRWNIVDLLGHLSSSTRRSGKGPCAIILFKTRAPKGCECHYAMLGGRATSLGIFDFGCRHAPACGKMTGPTRLPRNTAS
jgi:hypothetical protein